MRSISMYSRTTPAAQHLDRKQVQNPMLAVVIPPEKVIRTDIVTDTVSLNFLPVDASLK